MAIPSHIQRPQPDCAQDDDNHDGDGHCDDGGRAAGGAGVWCPGLHRLSNRPATRGMFSVMRKGGNAELTSLLTQAQFQIVKNFPRHRHGCRRPAGGVHRNCLGHQLTISRQSGGRQPDAPRFVIARRQDAEAETSSRAGCSKPGQREVTVGKNDCETFPPAASGQRRLNSAKGIGP